MELGRVLKIQIISLSKGKEAYLEPLERNYQKRLSRFIPLEFSEVRRERVGDRGAFQKDWAKVKKRAGKSQLILLDEKGKTFTSVSLAQQLGRWMNSGRDISFVIGGPEGFPHEIKQEAVMLLSLSPLTFPHQLVRLILVEALYRANDILRAGPYHNA